MSDKSDHDIKPQGIRRRGFVFGLFAAAAAPETVFTRGESLGSVIEAATTKAAAIETPLTEGAALDTLVRNYFGREALRLENKRFLINLRIVAESFEPETAEEAAELAQAMSQFNLAPITNTIASLFTSKKPEGPIPPEILKMQQGYKGITDQLLAMRPNRTDLQACFQTLKQNEPEIYRLYFGDATIEQSAERFSQAIADGKQGMRVLNQQMEVYEQVLLEEEFQEKLTQLATKKISTFTDMAAARKAGGYPIPKGHPFATKPIRIAYQKHSGEWSKRIEPADENAPIPPSR